MTDKELKDMEDRLKALTEAFDEDGITCAETLSAFRDCVATLTRSRAEAKALREAFKVFPKAVENELQKIRDKNIYTPAADDRPRKVYFDIQESAKAKKQE